MVAGTFTYLLNGTAHTEPFLVTPQAGEPLEDSYNDEFTERWWTLKCENAQQIHYTEASPCQMF